MTALGSLLLTTALPETIMLAPALRERERKREREGGRERGGGGRERRDLHMFCT